MFLRSSFESRLIGEKRYIYSMLALNPDPIGAGRQMVKSKEETSFVFAPFLPCSLSQSVLAEQHGIGIHAFSLSCFPQRSPRLCGKRLLVFPFSRFPVFASPTPC